MNKKISTEIEVFQYLFDFLGKQVIIQQWNKTGIVIEVEAKGRFKYDSQYKNVKSYLRNNGFLSNNNGIHYRVSGITADLIIEAQNKAQRSIWNYEKMRCLASQLHNDQTLGKTLRKFLRDAD